MKRLLTRKGARRPKKKKTPQSISFHQDFLGQISSLNDAGKTLIPILTLASELLQTTGKDDIGVTAQIAAVRKIATCASLGLEAEASDDAKQQFEIASLILIRILLDQNSKVLHKELLKLFEVLSSQNRPATAKPAVHASFARRFEELFALHLENFIDRISKPVSDEELGGRLEDAAAVDSLLTFRLSSERFSARRADIFIYFVIMLEQIAETMHQEDVLVQWTEADASAAEFTLVTLVQFLRVHPLTEALNSDFETLKKLCGDATDAQDAAAAVASWWKKHPDSSARASLTFGMIGRSMWAMMDLLTSPVCSKDATYAVGLLMAICGKMLLASTAKVASVDDIWMQDQIIGTFLRHYAKEDAKFSTCIFDVAVRIGAELGDDLKNSDDISVRQFFSEQCHAQAQICILRGIVVAFSSDPESIKWIAKPSKTFNLESGGSILYEGIIPDLFKFCEKNSERYIRFLAFRGVDSTIEEAANVLRLASNVDSALCQKTVTLLHDTMALLMRNWEDPFDAINNQIKSIFRLVLALNDTCASVYGEPAGSQDYGSAWVHNMTQQLLDIDWRKKGKYAVLVILLDRLGTKSILQLGSRTFLERVIEAMSFMSVGKQASMLLELFLKALKTDMEKNEVSLTPETAYEMFLPPLIKALFNDDVFKDVVIYGVPLCLDMFPDCLPIFLRQICDFSASGAAPVSSPTLQHARALIAVLKMARKVGRVMGYQMETCLEDFGCRFTAQQVIEIAITTSDEEIRFDALSLLMTSRRSTEPISLFELNNSIRFLHYNMTESSQAFRRELNRQFDLFCQRLRDSSRLMLKSLASSGKGKDVSIRQEAQQRAQTLAQETVHLIGWFSQWFPSCAHPASPYQRKVTTLELMSLLVNSFTGSTQEATNVASLLESAGLGAKSIENHLFTQMNCEILFNCLWDKFEVIRGLSHQILLCAPAPIPAYDTPERLIRLLQWCIKILNSPRTRDCDSGANALRVIVQKYILEAAWAIRFQVDPASGDIDFKISQFTDASEGHLLDFLDDMLNFLEHIHLKGAQTDLKRAALATPIHGPLMAVRYLLGDVSLSVVAEKSRWATWIQRVIRVCRAIGDIAYAQSICYNIGEENNDSSIGSAAAGEADGEEEDAPGDSLGHDIHGGKAELQLVVVMAWLCAKEVHFTLGSVAKTLLPAGCEEPLHALATVETLVSMGDYVLERSLLRLKHVGAIETASDGFQLICEAFLRSRIKSMHSSPQRWIDLMLKRIETNPHSLLLTRRSAGLPVAFVSMLRGEVIAMRDRRGHILLSYAMTNLLKICSLPENQENDPDNRKQVHSLNVIRHIIRDKVLVDDVGPFVEDVLMTVIRLYASSQWSVKNSATMAFSTLLERCLGDKQRGTMDQHSRAVASVTCSEFFARFPAVYPFLLRQLDESTASMRHAAKESVRVSDYAPNAKIELESSGRVQSPSSTSLYAIMALLSRFAAARQENAVEQNTSINFVPYVISCVNSADFHVRVMSARALAPLIITKDVPQLVGRILSISASSHDHLHGIFLQIFHLLRCHHRHLTMDDERRAALTTHALVPLSNALKYITSLPCSPISSVIMQILLEFVVQEVPKLSEGTVRDSLLPLYRATLEIASTLIFPPTEAAQQLSDRLRTDIMYFKLREVAAGVVSHVVTNARALSLVPSTISAASVAVDADSFVLGMIEDQQYEVRLIALRALRSALKSSSGLETADASMLQLALLSHLGIAVGTENDASAFTETHAKCVGLSVKLLNQLGHLPLPPHLLEASISALTLQDALSKPKDTWSRLWALYSDEKMSLSIRGGAFVYMGAVIHQLCAFLHAHDKSNASSHVARLVISRWVQLALENAAVDQPIEWRQFVVDSLCAADLSHLSIPPNAKDDVKLSWEHALVQYCQVLLRIVQDDDVDLRRQTTLQIARLFAADTGSPVVDINVSRSIQFIFEYLGSGRFGGSSRAIVETLIYLMSSSQPGELPVRVATSPDDSQFALFDPEKDNMFVDVPCNLQSAFLHLVALFKADNQHRNLLLDAAASAKTRLHTVATFLKAQHEVKPDSSMPLRQLAKATSEWQTFGEEMFLEVYRIGLTLLAVVHTSTDASEPSSIIDATVIHDLDILLRTGVLHPLMRYLFAHILLPAVGTKLADGDLELNRDSFAYADVLFLTKKNLEIFPRIHVPEYLLYGRTEKEREKNKLLQEQQRAAKLATK